MLQFNPYQSYFFGREVGDRLQQAVNLGLESSHQILGVITKTVRFHADAMNFLMNKTSGIQDIAGIKKTWSEAIELAFEGISFGSGVQKQTAEMVVKYTEVFYTNVVGQSATAEPEIVRKASK